MKEFKFWLYTHEDLFAILFFFASFWNTIFGILSEFQIKFSFVFFFGFFLQAIAVFLSFLSDKFFNEDLKN